MLLFDFSDYFKAYVRTLLPVFIVDSQLLFLRYISVPLFKVSSLQVALNRPIKLPKVAIRRRQTFLPVRAG